MRRRLLVGLLALVGVTSLIWFGLTEVWGYSTAEVRSGGAIQVVDVPAAPESSPRPFVYCTATDIEFAVRPIVWGKDITITCYNDLPRDIELSITYTHSPELTADPTFSWKEPPPLTVPTRGSAEAILTATVGLFTPARNYIVTYTVSTPGNPPVDITFTFTSLVIVPVFA